MSEGTTGADTGQSQAAAEQRPAREASRPRRRYRRGRRKVCRFCADKTLRLDYKWAHVLEEFITERGRIVPARTSGTCASHQRRLKVAIKRARNAALLPYTRM
ncbi:MAG: 30S ribosomal protein S18 [Candidatus Dadabacteria bacterium]|nr:MAG: 30S ribosomal protein S18 [Candidatus Dadabacteria bacterium]